MRRVRAVQSVERSIHRTDFLDFRTKFGQLWALYGLRCLLVWDLTLHCQASQRALHTEVCWAAVSELVALSVGCWIWEEKSLR